MWSNVVNVCLLWLIWSIILLSVNRNNALINKLNLNVISLYNTLMMQTYTQYSWEKRGLKVVPNLLWVFRPLNTTPSSWHVCSDTPGHFLFFSRLLFVSSLLCQSQQEALSAASLSLRTAALLSPTFVIRFHTDWAGKPLAWLWRTSLWPSFTKAIVPSSGLAVAGGFFLLLQDICKPCQHLIMALPVSIQFKFILFLFREHQPSMCHFEATTSSPKHLPAESSRVPSFPSLPIHSCWKSWGNAGSPCCSCINWAI